VLLEASASGLPVVAGDSGGAPETVREGETGHVVGGRDLTALADVLVELLADPDRAARMGAAGRSWMLREWALPALVDRLHGLLGGGRAPSTPTAVAAANGHVVSRRRGGQAGCVTPP
jgi:phosphatidylinositol alpha-1,6-mannosyltransferase